MLQFAISVQKTNQQIILAVYKLTETVNIIFTNPSVVSRPHTEELPNWILPRCFVAQTSQSITLRVPMLSTWIHKL